MEFETGRFAEVETSTVNSRSDSAEVLHAVLEDFRSSGEEEWENGTLDRFLDAFAAFADTRTTGRIEKDQERPTWRLFAEIVVAATGHE